MNVGDLVVKTGGYNSEARQTGVIIDFSYYVCPISQVNKQKVVVLTSEGIENWITKLVEKL